MPEVYKWYKGLNNGDNTKDLNVNNNDKTRFNWFKLNKIRIRKKLERLWFGSRMLMSGIDFKIP